MPSALDLLKRSISLFRQNWAGLVVIVAVVSVPSAVFSLLASEDVQLRYVWLVIVAGLLSEAALLYAAVALVRDGRMPSFGDAYKGGLAKILPILGLLLVVAGVYILGLTVLAVVGVVAVVLLGAPAIKDSGAFALVAMGVLAAAAILVLAFYFSIRLSFANKAIFWEGLGPIKSIKKSFHLTKGQVWPVARKLLFLGLIALLLVVPMMVLSLVELHTKNGALLVANQLLGLLYGLFFGVVAAIYQVLLYKHLLVASALSVAGENGQPAASMPVMPMAESERV